MEKVRICDTEDMQHEIILYEDMRGCVMMRAWVKATCLVMVVSRILFVAGIIEILEVFWFEQCSYRRRSALIGCVDRCERTC